MTDRPRGTNPPADDDALRRLLSGEADPSRLTELLAALAADPAPGPQPGEAQALASFRELVAAPAGVVSLASRRRLRAVAVASSVLVVMGGGVAAAAAGALPDPAQSVVKNVLGVVGVHVPAPHPTPHSVPTTTAPGGGDGSVTSGQVGASTAASAHPTSHGRGSPSPHPSHPAHPTHPSHPAHPSTPPTPGNAGSSRHHGNPTPTATTHPSPGHGKPTAPPATSHRKSPHLTPKTAGAVTRGNASTIHP